MESASPSPSGGFAKAVGPLPHERPAALERVAERRPAAESIGRFVRTWIGEASGGGGVAERQLDEKRLVGD